MKKSKLLCLVLAGLLCFSGCSSKTGMKAGTYEATAKGFSGDLTVNVTVDSEKITGIEIVNETETPTIGSVALPMLVESVLDSQSIAVDAITGATVTSDAFKAALKDALTQAGADIEKMSQPVEKDTTAKETVKLTTDVIVVGAGGAGLTSALASLQGGAKVIVLEKMAYAGGATSMAGGGTNATGSTWQKEQGLEDSPEQLVADLKKNGQNSNDEATVQLYANTVGVAFDWLVDPSGAGLEYDNSVPNASAEHSVGRNYSAVGGGSAVVNSLSEKVSAAGGEIMLNTQAIELIVENGKVIGVKALGTDGTPYEITGTVILATGGFAADESLLPEDVKKLAYAGAVSATGDGLKMAQAIGADTVNMDKINIQPHSIILPDGRGQHTFQGVLAMYGGTGSILVSDQGVRFVNERGSAYDIKAAMEKNANSYLIMDAASFDTYAQTCIKSKNFTQEQLDSFLASNGATNPVFVKADTLADLSNALKMPEGTLVASVEKYNTSVANGNDEEFGRKVSTAMADGPYYAVEMNLRYYASLGGLRINDNMQVVNADQSPIEGLYAAGEVVGGLCGDIYAPGSLFGWAMTSGKNAGDAASASIK